jgi:hypothetical protein
MGILKRKRGPKTELGEHARVVKKSIAVDELTLRKLSALGKGNLSRGVREAARVAYDIYQRTPD